MDEILEQAAELFITEQYDYAIYLYTSLIEDNSSHNLRLSEIYHKRANCYAKINKIEDAIRDYETSIKLDQKNPITYKKLINLYLSIGKTNEAREILTKMKNINGEQNSSNIIDPDKIEELEIRERQIKNAFEKGDYERTVNLIDTSKKSDGDFNLKLLKSRCLIYLGKFEESLKIINEILFINNENHEAYFLRGLNLIYQQKYRLGLEDLRYARRNVPEAKEMYDKYKNIELLLNQIRNVKNVSKDLYLEILKIDSKNKRLNNYVYFKLAQSLYLTKNYSETILYCTEILLNDEKNLNALKLRIKAYEKSFEFEDAFEDCNELLRLQNNMKNHALIQKIKNLMYFYNVDNFTKLGVKFGANLSEVRKAYFKLSKMYHPDKKIGNLAEQFIANRKFCRIKKAYEELENVLKKN